MVDNLLDSTEKLKKNPLLTKMYLDDSGFKDITNAEGVGGKGGVNLM